MSDKGLPAARIEPVRVAVPQGTTVDAVRPAPQSEGVEDPRRIIRQGLLVVGLFFGAMGLWSVFGMISGAVVAPGSVKIESERKTVQHLEGGIVEHIAVREGEEVEAGQTLIVLESVRVQADTALLRKQLASRQAAAVRLSAERDLAEALEWPEPLRREAEEAGCPEALDAEAGIFASRRDSLRTQLSLLDTQMAQLKAQAAGIEDQIRAERSIIRALEEELGAKRRLFAEQYLEKSQILELERNLAGHRGELGRLRQAAAEARQKAAELDLRAVEVTSRFREEAVAELGRVDNEIRSTRESLRPLQDAGRRLRVVAPVSGRVVDLKVHSRGGVVRPGEPLMDIVPHDNPLIVETRVPVNKITEVRPGGEALVQLDAFDTRLVPHMPGRVAYISADRLEENTAAGAMPYYLCYVEVDPEALKEENLYLSPGMPATVFITTGKSSVLYYMLEPLIKNWDRALRE